jgi:phage gp29-like protein
MPGLWLTENQYVDFAETPDRAALTGELATRGNAMEWLDLMGMLPDPDPVLRKLDDGGVKVFEGLLADGHLISVVQSRKLGTLKKEFRFEPGSLKGEEPSAAAVKLRDDLVEDLENVDLYNLVSSILDAPLYGMSPVEILWASGDARLRIADLIGKPVRWFGFDTDNHPRFRSAGNPWQGEDLPFGKFVFARHFPTYDNPYGLRLLSRCFWPAAFKKGGLKFWVTLAEKYGMPFLLGKYRQGAPPSEQQDMLNKLAGMVRDACAVIPQGGTVEILDNKGGATADIHERLKSAMDAEMSKVIMGQTLTAEVSAQGGSRAQGQVHEDILEDFRDGDQKLVKTTMEEIAWLYGRINAPGVPTPSFKWYEEEEPQKEFADRDKTLQETGVRFRKSYYVRRYGLQEDDFDLTGEKPQPSAEFAEPGAAGRADLIEQLTAQALDQNDGSELVEAVYGLLTEAASLEEVRDRLLDLYPDMALASTGEALAQALALAELQGRADVEDEA